MPAMEDSFRVLAECASDGILIALDPKRHAYVNDKAAEITGYPRTELLVIGFRDLAHPEEVARLERRYRRRVAGDAVPTPYETRIVRKDGRTLPVEISSARIMWHGTAGVLVILRDISRRKALEAQAAANRKLLEKKVFERTRELESKNRQLADANTTLNVLLEKGAKDRYGYEQEMYTKILTLISPFLSKLKLSASKRQAAYLEAIEKNLNALSATTGVTGTLEGRLLTPAEIEIASLIKLGKSNKAIAGLLGLSVKTIETHRRNIRKKMQITNRKVNLRALLLSLDN